MRKLHHIAPFLRQRAIIVLQEVRGSRQLLIESLKQVTSEYDVHFCAAPLHEDGSPAGYGGVAVLVPHSAADVIAALTAEDRPQQWQDIVVPGRVQVVHIHNPMSNASMRIMNVHNFDFTAPQLAATAAAWHAAACWAAEDVENRTFIAIGDFNLNATQTASYIHPAPGQARRPAVRYRQHPRQWKDMFDDQMVEVTSELPTRYDKTTDTATCIDRAFV